jgi:hypothetical protein
MQKHRSWHGAFHPMPGTGHLPSQPLAPPSTSFSQPSRTRPRLSVFSQKPPGWSEPSGTAGNQYRQACCLSASHRHDRWLRSDLKRVFSVIWRFARSFTGVRTGSAIMCGSVSSLTGYALSSPMNGESKAKKAKSNGCCAGCRPFESVP